MAEVIRTIRYQGNAKRLMTLLDMLKAEGVRVEMEPPEGYSSLGALDLNEVVVSLISAGSLAGITAGVDKFRKRFRRHKAEILPADVGQPDDGVFLDG
jgi:hypothetical protein